MDKEPLHFIGIGGIGMSALARIALGQGRKVSGSDVKSSAIIKDLEQEGAKVFIGHEADNLPLSGKVVYSTDIAEDNIEFMEAKRRRLPLMHRSYALAELMDGLLPLLVTGTHGKTTTSSLLAHVLQECGENPSYAIGGVVQSFGKNGGWGNGKWFAAEADESDRSFLVYSPYGAIITNIGIDHLNHWHTEENLIRGFYSFYQHVQNKNLLFWCQDDRRLSKLPLEGVSYGFSPKSDLKIEKVSYLGWKSIFTLYWQGLSFPDIEIPLIGAHNVLNATAVFGLCLKIGIEEQSIRKALLTFLGVKRRVEKKGEVKGIAIYDDYGHHPTEIAATLEALKMASQDRRVVVAFQPHRFSRTKDCFEEFAPALQKADIVILTDVYSAGETAIEGVNAEGLYETFSEKSSVHYVPKQELLEALIAFLQPGDVLVSMGAGDITHIGPELLKRLSS